MDPTKPISKTSLQNSPKNGDHILCHSFIQRSSSIQWNKPPEQYVHSHSNKKGWHSIWCHLCHGGGHHWNVSAGWDTLIPWVCSAILQQNQLFYFDWQTRCNSLPMEPLRQQFYARRSLLSGLLTLPKPTWGLTWLQWVVNHSEPNLHPHRGGGTTLACWKPPNPHPGGQTPHCIQAHLGDLADNELCQLLEDLHQEVSLCELNAPPRSPPPMLWGTQQGAGILMWMTRWSPFQERKGGFPRTTIPTSCSHTPRWRMGSTGTTSSTPNSCSA